MGQKLTQEHIQFDPQHIGNGLTIRFGERAGFSPGSTRVNSTLAKALGEFGRTMEHYSHTIVVEGFTDAAFKPTPRYPTAEALSLGRARAAAEVMLRNSSLPPELVQVAGLGTLRLRSDQGQDTALARRADRRVEVRVVALDSARAQLPEERR
jgi:flagellar motor protein MotB